MRTKSLCCDIGHSFLCVHRYFKVPFSSANTLFLICWLAFAQTSSAQLVVVQQDSHTTTETDLICVGKYTSEEFPQQCDCQSNIDSCHRCVYRDSIPHQCLSCKNRRALLEGKCVSEDVCRAKGGAVRGTGTFERICEGTNKFLSQESVERLGLTTESEKSSQSAPDKKIAFLCEGKGRTRNGTRCMCILAQHQVCVGTSCSGTWVQKESLSPHRLCVFFSFAKHDVLWDLWFGLCDESNISSSGEHN